MKEISIGIISYNEEKNIITLLNSIKSQNIPAPFLLKEIVISDDSSDVTPDLIRDFIKANPNMSIRLFHSETRRGAALGWNEIFRESSGDILVLYDADIRLEKNCTFNLVKSISGKDIGLCASNPQPIKYSNIYGRATTFISNWLRKIRRSNLTRYTVMGRGLAIRNDLAKKIIIPEDIIAIDLFLQNKLIELDEKIWYNDDAKVFFKSPSTLYDFSSQVLRARSGHRQISFYKGEELPASANLKATVGCFLKDPVGGLSTIYCYMFIPYYEMRYSKKISSAKWYVAKSTKR